MQDPAVITKVDGSGPAQQEPLGEMRDDDLRHRVRRVQRPLVPHGAGWRVAGSVVGWGVGLGALTGLLFGVIFGFLLSELPGGAALPTQLGGLGLLVGGAIGLGVSLVCAVALVYLLPSVVTGKQTPRRAANMASLIAVLVPFALSTLWCVVGSGISALPAWLAVQFVLALVVYGPCVWAANRALKGAIPSPAGSR